MIDKIPGPKAYPFIGTGHLVIGKRRDQIFHIFSAFRKEFPGGIYRLWHGFMPEIKVSEQYTLLNIKTDNSYSIIPYQYQVMVNIF